MPPENDYSLNSVLHKYREIQCGHKYISSVSTAGEIRDQQMCEFYIQTKQIQHTTQKLPVKNKYVVLNYKINTLINKNTMTSSAGYMF